MKEKEKQIHLRNLLEMWSFYSRVLEDEHSTAIMDEVTTVLIGLFLPIKGFSWGSKILKGVITHKKIIKVGEV